MTAYNIVRFRVKPGNEKKFIAAHRDISHDLSGFRGGALIKAGERGFCLVGEWSSFEKIVAARPKMIGVLDSFRDLLEDLGGGLGATDPVSGEVVLELKRSKAKKAKKDAKKAKKTDAKKADAKKSKPKDKAEKASPKKGGKKDKKGKTK